MLIQYKGNDVHEVHLNNGDVVELTTLEIKCIRAHKLDPHELTPRDVFDTLNTMKEELIKLEQKTEKLINGARLDNENA